MDLEVVARAGVTKGYLNPKDNLKHALEFLAEEDVYINPGYLACLLPHTRQDIRMGCIKHKDFVRGVFNTVLKSLYGFISEKEYELIPGPHSPKVLQFMAIKLTDCALPFITTRRDPHFVKFFLMVGNIFDEKLDPFILRTIPQFTLTAKVAK
jgi:hypothetical protein